MLPNVVARFCTVELKIRTTQRYLKAIGWDFWTNAIGLRADEPHRVARLGNKANQHSNEDPIAPLATAGVTLADVNAFWDRQPFRLELAQHEGNCDLCFLKGAGKIRAILSERPDLADWWIAQEERIPRRAGGGTDQFRRDRPPYRIQLELAQRPGLFDEFESDELSIACHCTD
jgi:3'-phosphoadenosine 5'-phosphosulfate sulfotransferase (PAPS reductase)/FAD synthetase